MDLLTLLKIGLTLSCPATEFVDKSGLGILKEDRELVAVNGSFCEQRVGEPNVCLKIVYKKAPRTYHFICGAPVMLPPKGDSK